MGLPSPQIEGNKRRVILGLSPEAGGGHEKRGGDTPGLD